MNKILLSLVISFFVNICCAQSFSFTGIPTVKIIESGVERNVTKIDQSNASSFSCVIKEDDGKFYWVTRENKPLFKIESGAFYIFLALDGSGYIKVINPSFKEVASLMTSTEKTFDYVEHLNLGLRTVTYYGSSGASQTQ